MLITFFLIVLLTRVSSLDWHCVWESKMAVGKVMFRDIFLTPFGFYFDTESLTDLCGEKKPPDIPFWKHWGDALLKSLPSCDWLWSPETNRMIGEELFRAMFLTPFRLEWDPHEGNKPPDEISFWHYWDDPVFIFLDFLFAICLAIIVYTCVLWLKFLVAKEKQKKDENQEKQTTDKTTQTEQLMENGLARQKKIRQLKRKQRRKIATNSLRRKN